ncbi:MAG: PD-(D/E)XK nuclease family protein, partial [Gammaproteobacteria bacterium]
LGLGVAAVPLEDLGALLRSPFIGKAAPEGQRRARLDTGLRRHGESRITFTGLQWLIKNKYLDAQDMPAGFLDYWQKYRDLFSAHDKKQGAGDWAKLFSGLLQTFRWPGERSLDSAEYQTVAEWQDQLQRFAALDLVSPALSARDALALLRQMLMNASFQPETPEVPIQILGMTGAAAMQFDHLWIMGLHEEVWPGKAEPNPFIPVQLQRDSGIPGATPEIKLAQARNLMECLISSSPDVVLSYPQHENDRELRMSPLLKSYAVTTIPFPRYVANQYAGLIYQSRRMEAVEDARGPAVPAGQVVSGGSGLFRDQAACPFRAFARHRLYAEGLDSRDLGLDARARGSLMHGVMEKLWRRLGGSESLHNTPQDQLEKIINESVRAAIQDLHKQFPQTFTERFTQLETDRLRAMVHQFLEKERERRPFTVHACEQWHRFTFNDITINTRIDRIDRLVDGRYI